jgi:hypothetical protein
MAQANAARYIATDTEASIQAIGWKTFGRFADSGPKPLTAWIRGIP